MDAYLKKRQDNTDTSGTGEFAAGDSTDVALVTSKAGWSVFVQKLRVTVKTSHAATLTFESVGTSAYVEKTDTTPGDNTQYIWDFGPLGRQLPVGENFELDFSGAGLAGHYEHESYLKQVGSEYIRGAGTVGTGQAFA